MIFLFSIKRRQKYLLKLLIFSQFINIWHNSSIWHSDKSREGSSLVASFWYNATSYFLGLQYPVQLVWFEWSDYIHTVIINAYRELHGLTSPDWTTNNSESNWSMSPCSGSNISFWRTGSISHMLVNFPLTFVRCLQLSFKLGVDNVYYLVS